MLEFSADVRNTSSRWRLLITAPSVDNWLLEAEISQQEQDKHNGRVNSPELTRQFGPEKREI
jgi:hypothetical protein